MLKSNDNFNLQSNNTSDFFTEDGLFLWNAGTVTKNSKLSFLFYRGTRGDWRHFQCNVTLMVFFRSALQLHVILILLKSCNQMKYYVFSDSTLETERRGRRELVKEWKYYKHFKIHFFLLSHYLFPQVSILM